MKNQTKHPIKTVIIYAILSILATVVNKVYAIFGHGVSSPAMTWMFLYPLIGGALFYFLIYGAASRIIRFNGYRLFFNIYNSGIATLTFGSFLKGILEIAGADSIYLVFYYAVGAVFIAAGLILAAVMIVNQKRVKV
jgi:hypothetical protein